MWFGWLLLFVLPVQASAQQAGRPARNVPKPSAFDVLRLKDKSVLYGVQLGRTANEIYYGVRRAWLKSNDTAYRQRASILASEERRAYEQLRDRLQSELATHHDQPHRFVLEQEHDRAIAWLSAEPPLESELMLLTIPLADVIRLDRNDDTSLRCAIWAWGKQVDAPESTPAVDLRRTLEAIGVDLKGDTPDLGNRFQAMPQSDDEWQARMALVRYSRVGAIEFQGVAGMMMRIEDTNKPANIAQLLTQSLKNQSQKIVDELLNDPNKAPGASALQDDWIQQSIAKLRDASENYMRATRVETDPTSGQVRVESVFAFKSSHDGWIPIWRVESTVDANSVSDGSLRRLEEDSQVRSLRSVLSSLGFQSDELIQNAIRTGAATMQAQQQVNSRFELFRQRYQHRLDLPVLRWDISQQ